MRIYDHGQTSPESAILGCQSPVSSVRRSYISHNMEEGPRSTQVGQGIESEKEAITRLLPVVRVVQDCQFAGGVQHDHGNEMPRSAVALSDAPKPGAQALARVTVTHQ
jgi:hypothetical protein